MLAATHYRRRDLTGARGSSDPFAVSVMCGFGRGSWRQMCFSLKGDLCRSTMAAGYKDALSVGTNFANVQCFDETRTEDLTLLHGFRRTSYTSAPSLQA